MQGTFGYALPFGRVFGIPLSLHWTLPALLIGVFLFDLLSAGGWERALITLGVGAGWVVSVLLHELSHALAAHRFGGRTQAIELHAFGGIAQISGWMAPRHEMLVALAGPAMNVALFFVLKAVAVHLPPVPGLILLSTAWTNLLLGLFNLLPAFPLDGGRALLSGLRVKMGPVKGDRLAYTVGLWTAGPGLVWAIITSQALAALAFYVAFEACRTQRARLDAAFGGNVVRPFRGGEAASGGGILAWLRSWFGGTREPQPPKLRVIRGGRFEEPPDKRRAN